jgi:hypothetical protein
MEENQNHVENMWTRPDLFFKVFSTSTQIRGYFGGHASRRSLAVPRQSLVVPWQSLAAPRLRHGRGNPPYRSHLCSLPFCFMDAFQ